MEAALIKWSAKTIPQNSSNVYSHFCVLGLLVISYFLWIFSHGLIPSTSRLRINYMSIEWPLDGGIDIHGPPSAPRPMCIPQVVRPYAFHQDTIIYYLRCGIRMLLGSME